MEFLAGTVLEPSVAPVLGITVPDTERPSLGTPCADPRTGSNDRSDTAETTAALRQKTFKSIKIYSGGSSHSRTCFASSLPDPLKSGFSLALSNWLSSSARG